ncbi:MAG: glycine--tRNA ligase subunit beta, partial [Candidatus Poribacteria bacterium]|nr:glycine--tRNA ligase subunit beta [Candidatus Poribacteria bacterium]
ASGPPKSAAYDADGNPTKAAQGFARGQGVNVEDLYIKKTEKGEYVHAKKMVKGRLAADLLAGFLPELVKALRFPKSMRWDNLRFARPIRWLVALLGDQVVDFPFDTLRSGRTTRGHRFLGGNVTLDNADASAYLSTLKAQSVIVDQTERRDQIRAVVQAELTKFGSPTTLDESLLDEVLYLVEFPEAVVGSFDESHLSMPPDVLVTAMKKHQRYFPVTNADGTLQAKFVTISNGTRGGESNIRYGNERVLRSRLEDCAFFWDEDRKEPLGEKVEALKRVRFLAQIGDSDISNTVYDKTVRVRKLVEMIHDELGIYTGIRREQALRAADLIKADLTTRMVFEMPELQGTMGKHYALASGEDTEVADAIEEHYMPLSADGELPQSNIGTLLSIADKMDTLALFFGLENAPTGSQDPFSLRRQTIGVCRMLLENRSPLSLAKLIEHASSNAGFSTGEGDDLEEFFEDRLHVLFRDRGHQYDVIDAVLRSRFQEQMSEWYDRLCDVPLRLDALRSFRSSSDFDRVYPSFNRILRILTKIEDMEPTVDLLTVQAEKSLYHALQTARPTLDKCAEAHDFAGLLDELKTLQPAINAFFDDVLVMDKDEAVRNNRLALLGVIGRYLLKIGDFSKLVIAGE